MDSETSSRRIPEIPAKLVDPRPVLVVGTTLWAIATAVVWTSGNHWHAERPVCLMGMAVGALGYTIFLVQRRGARRGDKGAQKGLEGV